MDQIAIQVILITVFVVFALVLLLPERGSRRLAIRRIVLAMLFLVMVVGVAQPGLVDRLANMVGVGRGTDLLLYGLFVVYVGQSIASARRHRHMEQQITLLARRLAIDSAEPGSRRDTQD